MAKSTGFLFTNTTATTSKAVSLYDMGETTNYSFQPTANGDAKGINATGTSLSTTSEIIEVKSKKFNSVNMPLNLEYKKAGIGAVQYSVGLSTFVRTTDSTDPDFIQDDPIYVQVTIRHSRAPFVTEALLGQALGRCISALQHSNGDWRFDELAKGATVPNAN